MSIPVRLSVFAALALLAVATGCEEKAKLVVVACLTDRDCPDGQLCEQGRCVAMSKFRCDAVAGGAGVLQPSPHVVDFGATGSDPVSQEITLRNIGNCSLTLFEASLTGAKGTPDGGVPTPFTCDGCGDKSFPLEIFPMREKKITVGFTAPKVGTFTDKIEFLSDDAEFPTLPLPLRARFDGIPKLVATPNPVKFGYVAQGDDAPRVVSLSNHGSGIAQVNVVDVHLEPADGTAFSLDEPVDHPLPTADKPVTLAPTSLDPKAGWLFTVHYHPREVADDTATLVVGTDSALVGTLRIPLAGTSQTPPELSISPEIVDFKQVPLGQMMAQTITLVNHGGSPLTLSYSFKNSCPAANPKCSTDFSFEPQALPSIDPGKFYEMKVFVLPSSAEKIQGLLRIDSNDPRRATTTVNVSAEGINDGTQVVKVEVSYENGSDGTFDNDLRRLEATLENPYGFMCGKADPKPVDWGDFGNPSWMALGAKLNPQRVILVNPKVDGKYRVLLQYTEDCSWLPSQLLSSLLGISIDALILYLTGGVSAGVDPGKISGAIDQACFSHSATNATVTVWVNGKTIAEKPATLAKKGDFLYAIDLVRSGGQFSVP